MNQKNTFTSPTAIQSSKPEGFTPEVEVGLCFYLVKGQTLLLKSANHKKAAGYWTAPAGRIDPGETIIEGTLRELYEESGLTLQASDLSFLSTLYISKPDIDYTLHLFYAISATIPNVKLSDEHSEYEWTCLSKVKSKNLLPGGLEAFEFLFQELGL